MLLLLIRCLILIGIISFTIWKSFLQLPPPPQPSPPEESGGWVAYNRGDGEWKRKGYDLKKVDRTEWKDEETDQQLVLVPRRNGESWDHDADDELYLERLMKEGYVMPSGETASEEVEKDPSTYHHTFYRMPSGSYMEVTSEEVEDC